MTVTDERLDQIARKVLADAIADACTDAMDQTEALHEALADDEIPDFGPDVDELVARFDAALGRVKAELIQEGN